MKKIPGQIILTLVFLLTACGGDPPPAQPTLDSSTEASTATPSPLPTATQTTHPTETPTAIASLTPLPTISTFTPTFDARTILTVTPASPAECPKEDTNLKPDFPYCIKGACEDAPYAKPILDYLNNGGTRQSVLRAFDPTGKILPNGYIFSADLTNDTVPEFVYSDEHDGLVIIGCTGGKYQMLLRTGENKYAKSVIGTQDLNGDGILDVATEEFHLLQIYGWNGSTFATLQFRSQANELNDYFYVWGNWKYSFQTTDNKTYQLALELGPLTPYEFRTTTIQDIPYRTYKTTLSWNGVNFLPSCPQYTSIEYRFQAIQDADQIALQQKYDAAIELYRQVIFSNKLGWWSLERRNYEYNFEWRKLSKDIFTPMPEPQSDLTEYPKLAAYAYYRIMLLHTVRGYESDAGIVYNTLQQKFGSDLYGRPYAEMATAFWEAYQSTHKMYDGCAAAIQYAAEHPEILIPLGSDYHGWQSKTYTPEDVCPFR